MTRNMARARANSRYSEERLAAPNRVIRIMLNMMTAAIEPTIYNVFNMVIHIIAVR